MHLTRHQDVSGGGTKTDVIRRLMNFLPPLTVFLAVIVVWELSVLLLQVPTYLLPAPYLIAQRMVVASSLLLKHTGITMVEALCGFILGNAIGIVTGVLFAHSKLLERSFYPYAIALKTVPLVALAPLLVLWFGNGLFAKIVMSALICYFPAIVNTLRGLNAVSMEARDLMNSLSATKWQMLMKVRMPTALPFIFAALKISSTLSVIGAIVGELAGSTQGIGYIILTSSYRIETEMVFAAIAASSLAGIGFFALIHLWEQSVLYWHEGAMEEAM